MACEGEVFAWGYSRVLDGASLVRFCGQKKLASVSHTYSILILMINRVKDTYVLRQRHCC